MEVVNFLEKEKQREREIAFSSGYINGSEISKKLNVMELQHTIRHLTIEIEKLSGMRQAFEAEYRHRSEK
jgi:hypothetical protein